MALFCRSLLSGLFFYSTARSLRINSKSIGIIFHLVQTAILAYVIGWIIIWQKGYQETDEARAAVTTKLEGVAYTNFSDADLQYVPIAWRSHYRRIWDVSDYVVPHSEEGALFMITNVIITPDQNQGVCAESPAIPGAICNPRASKCRAGESLPHGHGVMTGRCIKTQNNFNKASPTGHTCEVHSWCPIEKDVKPLGPHRVLLEAAENFTLLIKNHIEFPKFNIRRSNILDSISKQHLATCKYDPKKDPFCPIFTLQTIAQLTGHNFTHLAVNGSIVSLGIRWNCDLDYNFEQNCRPTYHFRRLDSASSKLSPGWNFRFSKFFANGKRTLHKAFGILFVVDIRGNARRFSPIPLLINLGAGLGLLSLASIFCDFLVFKLIKDRKVFSEKKYLLVSRKDAFIVDKSQPVPPEDEIIEMEEKEIAL